jgi:EAL domain-containing protein (putative c-di-GMP-specific phosphodiesterase class I)
MPVSEIKIDKSFVQSMATSSEDKVIVRLIIELGHTLGLDTVAEGVETTETIAMLADIGCTMAQGYYVGRPMPAEALELWIADNAAPPAIATGAAG